MNGLNNRIPPPLIAFLCALLMWLGAQQWSFNLQLALPWRLGIALPIMLLGVLLSMAGMRLFRQVRTSFSLLKPQKASALVTSGVYQYTRNPMYLGIAVVLLAWTLLLAWPPALLGVVGFVLYMNRFQISAEERALHALFGQDFAHYCARVRRWV